ncbi:hypothetical protein P7K49_000520 [Saguinus oedipus]|uniref:[tau protein] kinase n=1 Tax=Saguinus oedipus TaxID=9490 RepID=A0ABQ9WBY0_SAGOE|nr:hypothetical protein P7K49_000520 [Saguinus oedipus]
MNFRRRVLGRSQSPSPSGAAAGLWEVAPGAPAGRGPARLQSQAAEAAAAAAQVALAAGRRLSGPWVGASGHRAPGVDPAVAEEAAEAPTSFPPPGVKLGRDSGKVTTVVATLGQGPERSQEVAYTDIKVIGYGSFGVMYQARLAETRELVAIKKVLQDKRFKNRKLQIMGKLDHCNIVRLRYFFYCSGEKKDEVYLNLVLAYVPETVYPVAHHLTKANLAYIHSQGVCHHDIKPQNLLVDPDTSVLKLCNFGSAKPLVREEPNVSYICSRYYPGPQGSSLEPLITARPLMFAGGDHQDAGNTNREQIREMNPNYMEFKFPQIKAHPWTKVFKSQTPPEAIALCSSLLEYAPYETMYQHYYFQGLSYPEQEGQPPPSLAPWGLARAFPPSGSCSLLLPTVVHVAPPSHLESGSTSSFSCYHGHRSVCSSYLADCPGSDSSSSSSSGQCHCSSSDSVVDCTEVSNQGVYRSCSTFRSSLSSDYDPFIYRSQSPCRRGTVLRELPATQEAPGGPASPSGSFSWGRPGHQEDLEGGPRGAIMCLLLRAPALPTQA